MTELNENDKTMMDNHIKKVHLENINNFFLNIEQFTNIFDEINKNKNKYMENIMNIKPKDLHVVNQEFQLLNKKMNEMNYKMNEILLFFQNQNNSISQFIQLNQNDDYLKLLESHNYSKKLLQPFLSNILQYDLLLKTKL